MSHCRPIVCPSALPAPDISQIYAGLHRCLTEINLIICQNILEFKFQKETKYITDKCWAAQMSYKDKSYILSKYIGIKVWKTNQINHKCSWTAQMSYKYKYNIQAKYIKTTQIYYRYTLDCRDVLQMEPSQIAEKIPLENHRQPRREE